MNRRNYLIISFFKDEAPLAEGQGQGKQVQIIAVRDPALSDLHFVEKADNKETL